MDYHCVCHLKSIKKDLTNYFSASLPIVGANSCLGLRERSDGEAGRGLVPQKEVSHFPPLSVQCIDLCLLFYRKAMGVPEIEKKEEKKKETPKKKGKKKGKKKTESEEEEEEDEGADYVVESVLERKVVTGKRGKSHKVGEQGS